MSGIYDVNVACLRYVVPFQLNESFESAFRKVEEQTETILKKDKETGKKGPTGEKRRLWERKMVSLDGPESDLYGYIRNEFRFTSVDGVIDDRKTGYEWLFWRSDEARGKDGQKILEAQFFPDGVQVKQGKVIGHWDIVVSNVGLMLFRNRVGFLWYELSLPTSGLDSGQLELFQNAVRELNRDETALLWQKMKTNVIPAYGIIGEEKNGYTKYLCPLSMGVWVRNMISFLDASFFAERKSAHRRIYYESIKSVETLGCNVVKKEKENGEDILLVPDKAILFTYASLGCRTAMEPIENKLSYVYHIANGYKESYHFSDEIVQEIRRPFDDAFWYATQEGTAYVTWPSYDNREVFMSTITSKVRTDYFTLFIKTMYQSFSLLQYALRIQNDLSAVCSVETDDGMKQNLMELYEEVNLFLSKSMATSVSHIHHQSEFYVYLNKQLRVHEDVESVTIGLHALDSLQRERRRREDTERFAQQWLKEQEREQLVQREKEEREECEKRRDGKTQAIMGLFALLAIASALLDCFDYIDKFAEGGDWYTFSCTTMTIQVIFMVVIGIISLLAFGFTIWGLINAFRRKK